MPISFHQYVFHLEKEAVTITLLGMACTFFLFKLVYLDPDFSYASYDVIREAAYGGNKVGAYTWFLRGTRVLHLSPYWLVLLQYLLLQASSLWLVLKVFYILQPPAWVKQVGLAFLAINPLSLYLANYIGKEVLFTILFFSWAGMMLALLQRVSYGFLLLQGFLLAALLTLHTQVLYLILIMVPALLKAKGAWWCRLLSGLVAFSLCVCVVLVSMAAVKAPTVAFFLPFLGHFEQYAMGRDAMKYISYYWFQLKGPQLACHWYRGGYYLLGIFPVLWLLLYAGVIIVAIRNGVTRIITGLLPVQRYTLMGLLLALTGSLLHSFLYGPVWLGCQLPPLLLALLALLCSVPLPRPVCSR